MMVIFQSQRGSGNKKVWGTRTNYIGFVQTFRSLHHRGQWIYYNLREHKNRQ